MTTTDNGGHIGSTDLAPETPPGRAPLRRSGSDRLITGVAGGLAEHTGIDAVLFRVAFVALSVAGGAGVLLYAALWLLLPDADGRPGFLTRKLSGGLGEHSTGRTILLTVIGVFAAIALFGITDNWDGGLLIVLAVGLVAYLMLRDGAPRGTAPSAPAVSLTKDQDKPVPPLPAVRRRRTPLARITLSVLLVAMGVLALIDRRDGVEMLARGYLGVALGIIGLGLLLGAIWGRARGLIFLGITVLVLLIGASTFAENIQAGVGERNWTASTAATIDAHYRLGAGDAVLDLSTVDFTADDATTVVDVTVGSVRVLVPRDVDVRVTGDVQAGDMNLFGDETNGSDLHRTVTDNGPDGNGGGTLTLTANLVLGQLEVTRVN